MVKLLIVFLDNRMGGVHIRVLSVGKELRKRGIETILVAPKKKGEFAQYARSEGFKVYLLSLDRPRNVKSFNSVLANFKWSLAFIFHVFEISKVIKKENIDIVHVNGILNLQTPLAAFLSKKKIVWHLIGSLYPKIVVLFVMPLVQLLSNRIVFVAKRVKEYYIGKNKVLSNNKVSILYEPVDINRFNPHKIRQNIDNELKEEFKIESHEKIISCVGNINSVKGYEYLIESVNLVKKEIEKVRFMIVGPQLGTQRIYYKKLQSLISLLGVERNVIFTGKRSDIPQILSISDIFVLSSISEGTPIAILEAMAMKLPVVATNVGGISEQVIDGETGIVVPPRNPKALAKAITYLLKNPDKRITMGEKGKERAKEIFSLDRNVEGHIKIYQAVLQHRMKMQGRQKIT